MKATTSQTAPSGDFEEISDHVEGWQTTFLEMVRARKRIHYFLTEMPVIPETVLCELAAQGYIEIKLESDDYHRFLIPR